MPTSLLCLGLDYKRGGFVDRALEAFNEVLRLDPENEYALVNLEKLHEEQHQWQEAYEVRQRLAKLPSPGADVRNNQILAIPGKRAGPRGAQADGLQDRGRALRRRDRSRRTEPSRPTCTWATCSSTRGVRPRRPTTWEKLLDVAPDRAYLVFDRLESVFDGRSGPSERSPDSAAT